MTTDEKVDLLFRLIALEIKISDLREEKNSAVKEQKFDKAADLRQEEISALDSYKELIGEIKQAATNA